MVTSCHFCNTTVCIFFFSIQFKTKLWWKICTHQIQLDSPCHFKEPANKILTIFSSNSCKPVPQSYLQIAVLFRMNWFENFAAMPLKYAPKGGNVGKKSNLFDVKVRYEIMEIMELMICCYFYIRYKQTLHVKCGTLKCTTKSFWI